MTGAFGPGCIAGMDSFPFTDLLSLNILRQFLGPTHRFAHFFLRGLNQVIMRTLTITDPSRYVNTVVFLDVKKAFDIPFITLYC